MEHLDETRQQLRDWAKDHDLRKDWHEPDNQGVYATVRGRHLDNAFGNVGTGGEIVVTLRDDEGKTLTVNLATVLALAAR